MEEPSKNETESELKFGVVVRPRALEKFIISCTDAEWAWKIFRVIAGDEGVELDYGQKQVLNLIINDAKAMNNAAAARKARAARYRQKKESVPESASPTEKVEKSEEVVKTEPQLPATEPSGMSEFSHVTGVKPGRPTKEMLAKFLVEKQKVRKSIPDDVDIAKLTDYIWYDFEDRGWKDRGDAPITTVNFRSLCTYRIGKYLREKAEMESASNPSPHKTEAEAYEDWRSEQCRRFRVECDD